MDLPVFSFAGRRFKAPHVEDVQPGSHSQVEVWDEQMPFREQSRSDEHEKVEAGVEDEDVTAQMSASRDEE